MKGKMRLVGILVVTAFLIMAQPSVSIGDTFSGYWLPNDLDIFTIELTPTTGTGSFYMYDESKDDNLFLLSDNVYEGRSVYFSQDKDTGDWYAGVTFDDPDMLDLNLGNTKKFGFYFSDGANDYLSYELTEVTPGDDYRLYDSNTGMTVAVHDAAPVPSPASALLLASGIVGLIAFSRVRRIS